MSETSSQSSLSSIDEKSNSRDDINMKKDDVALDEKKSMDQEKTNRDDEIMKKDEEEKEEKKEEDTFVLIQIDDDNDEVGEFH